MSTYETTNTASLALAEQYLYGSSRLGVLDRKGRSYGLTDHLGNVRAVVNKFKEVKAAYEYYAFGMSLAKVDNGYGYGFNGQEREISLSLSTTSAEHWMYDGRLGRRWNLDPKPNPSISNYACFANNPIWFSDPLGDTVTLSKPFQGNEQAKMFYNTFSKTKEGIDFLKEYGVGGEKNTFLLF